MESKNRRSAENSERSGICDDVKVKFPLYVFPETMQKIDMLYEADNCKSKTEFIEKAIRFYCGYLLNKDSVAAESADYCNNRGHSKRHGTEVVPCLI